MTCNKINMFFEGIIPDFGEKLLDNDKIISYIFKKPGTYGFYLKNNKNLNGTIIVEP